MAEVEFTYDFKTIQPIDVLKVIVVEMDFVNKDNISQEIHVFHGFVFGYDELL